jgi:serine/threonine protein phosphatase PrpC
MAVRGANQAILRAAAAERKHRGMGATATIAVQLGERLTLAQIGDTRAYILRERRLVQITEDDTLVHEALRAGTLKLEEIGAFAHRSVVMKALGVSDNLEPTLTTVELRLDDVLLICSDGLHGLVDHATLRAILLRHRAPGAAARVLLDEALRAGGHDNLTILVARFEAPFLRPPALSDALQDRSLPV